MISRAAFQSPRRRQGVRSGSILVGMAFPALLPLPDESSDAPKILRPGWHSAVLVCQACEKRSKGPKKITARELARQLKKAAHEAKVARPRIVMTSCLGACPKKAFTVAAASPEGSIRMVAFRRGDDAGTAIEALLPNVMPG